MYPWDERKEFGGNAGKVRLRQFYPGCTLPLGARTHTGCNNDHLKRSKRRGAEVVNNKLW